MQVNIGNEVQKNGIDKENLAPFLASCKKNFDLDIIGLMCIPPNDDKSELYFKEMQELNKKFGFSDLSMGMSSDYISAIDNGATYIRVGSKFLVKDLSILIFVFLLINFIKINKSLFLAIHPAVCW